MKVVVGMDAGGTKLAVRAETLDGGRVTDTAFTAQGWEASPPDSAAAWLATHLKRSVPAASHVVAAAIGAQGCNSPEQGADLARALGTHGIRATVVNDGALLVPAAGLDRGIGVVVGTGSIGIGVDTEGNVVSAGGWGWVLGDEGGAPAIVREAARAALRAHEDGRDDDGLMTALTSAFGVATPERLARAVNDEPTVLNWGPHAQVVFAAADAGSRLAAQVIDDAARHLSALVGRLIARGATGATVVAAGSVIVRQPRLAEAFRERLRRDHPEQELRILDDDPVAGAVTLARRLLDRTGG